MGRQRFKGVEGTGSGGMNRDDTICGVATAVGASGIGVIRVSGPGALAVLGRVAPGWHGRGPERALELHWIVDPSTGERLDRALVAAMPGPRSYTGEDVVEVQIHGGPAVARAVLRAVVAAGARQADAGEFTLRAFLNGRLDLAQAEAVAALVEASSDQARRVALRQLSGGVRERLGPVRQRCVSALAELEARLDFPEEELDMPGCRALARDVRGLEEEVGALLREGERGLRLREGVRVVLLGRPNVGKSSLLNRLLGVERAIVDEEAGTTRDYVEGELELSGVKICLVDTAGQTRRAKGAELQGVEQGWEQARVADEVLVVLNLAEGVTEDDWRVMDGLGEAGWAVVLNQVDRVTEAELRRSEELLRGRAEVAAVTSAVSGVGVEALLGWLEREVGLQEGASSLPVVTEERQVGLLKSCLAALGRARLGLEGGLPEELVAVDLRAAMEALGQVLGEGVAGEVLEAIFSRFCIGK